MITKDWRERVLDAVKWLICYKQINECERTVRIVEKNVPILTLKSDFLVNHYDLHNGYITKEQIEEKLKYDMTHSIAKKLRDEGLIKFEEDYNFEWDYIRYTYEIQVLDNR